MRTAKDAFLVNEWLAADADARQAGDVALADGVSCDDEGCVVQMADGGIVALSLRPDAVADDCERAALIVTAKPAPRGCAAAVIDLARMHGQGAMALRRAGRAWLVEAVRPSGVDRPWNLAAPSAQDTELATAASRLTAPRAVDATPAEADLQAED